MLRDDLARNQRQEKWNLSSSQKDGKSCSVSQGQGLKSIPVNLFSGWIIQLHPGFCLGSSSISLLGLPTVVWLWNSVPRSGFTQKGTCDSHHWSQTLSRTWAMWSLFFLPPSSLQRHLNPRSWLSQTGHGQGSCIHKQLAAGKSAACKKDTSELSFLRPFPFPGVDEVSQQEQQLL